MSEEELAALDLEAQDGRGRAASQRVCFPPAGLSEEVRGAASASSVKPRSAGSSETNEAERVPQTGKRQRRNLQNGTPTRPLEQKISTERLSGWQRAKLMYKSGQLQKMSVATSALGALRKNKVESTRQMIRGIFDELDST